MSTLQEKDKAIDIIYDKYIIKNVMDIVTSDPEKLVLCGPQLKNKKTLELLKKAGIKTIVSLTDYNIYDSEVLDEIGLKLKEFPILCDNILSFRNHPAALPHEVAELADMINQGNLYFGCECGTFTAETVKDTIKFFITDKFDKPNIFYVINSIKDYDPKLFHKFHVGHLKYIYLNMTDEDKRMLGFTDEDDKILTDKFNQYPFANL